MNDVMKKMIFIFAIGLSLALTGCVGEKNGNKEAAESVPPATDEDARKETKKDGPVMKRAM